MKKCILITGTPGTGKTKYAKDLVDEIGNDYEYVDVSAVIRIKGLSEFHDEAKECDVVDEEKLVKELISRIESSSNKLVIDSHMIILPCEYVEKCIIMKCSIDELRKRLELRKYSEDKVRENLDCEIFDVCLSEAKEKGYPIEIIWTSEKKENKSD
ncbi:AAA family ATPase [Candidatus Woesearchaeota archaeon]|jgi:adenylate kinase|nr:AAA family ATPase [Candidatus Woesearchaeota archaeon]MBT6520224.1 AAA family ATPase [Candidatus Woesearchaeota archaeon]MBT7367235.1 AAA family ATPase [Candidatus Woesearchaeota archaeon]